MARPALNIDIQARADRNKAQRKLLPKDWCKLIDMLPDNCSIKDVGITFGYTAAVIHRWRHECREFDKAVQAKLSPYSRAAINKNTEHNTRIKPGEKAPRLTPDEIDDLIMRLIELPDQSLAKQARRAIRQLRAEKRAALSRLNEAQHSAHIRAAGRPLSAAGGVGNTDISVTTDPVLDAEADEGAE